MNRKIIAVLAAINASVVNPIDAPGGILDGVTAVFSPLATPVASKIEWTTPEILKISWSADIGLSYVIQQASSPLGPWSTFSIERAVESTNRRSTVIVPDNCFYLVSRAAQFPMGTNVNWGISFPSLSSNDLRSCVATWVWDNGTSNTVTGNGWNAPVTQSNLPAGIQIVTVTVRAPDNSVFSGQWAITVATNSSYVYGPNLVTNGKFETVINGSPVGWSKGDNWGSVFTYAYPVAGPNGSSDNAAQVSISNYASGDGKWYFPDILVTVGTRYCYEDSYRSSAATEVTLQITDSAHNLSYIDISSIPTSTNWTRTYVEFTVPANAVSLTVFHLLRSNGYLAIDNVSVSQINQSIVATSPREGMLSFDFDDGWRDPYLIATNLLEKAGFRGTFYVITSYTNLAEYVAPEDILAIQSKGHEIGSHTLTHPDLTKISLTEAEREINLSRFYLLTHGISRVTAFAYPYDAYNDTSEKITREAGYIVGRTVDGGLNNKYSTDFYALNAIGAESTTTLNDLKSYIDQAQTNKQWAVLVFHKISASGGDQYTVTTSLFSNVVSYAKSKGIKVVTASEGARLWSAP